MNDPAGQEYSASSVGDSQGHEIVVRGIGRADRRASLRHPSNAYSARMAPPTFIPPMLATLVSVPVPATEAPG